VMGSGVQPGLWGTIREREALERVAAELRTLAAIEEQEEGQTPTVKTDRSVSCRSSLTNYGSKSTAIISG
jgi:hypothetical protein